MGLSKIEIINYYSRRDVQEAIFMFSENREVAVRYRDEKFGKRPQVLTHPRDVYSFALKGATSFHISVERWKDPLQLRAGMKKSEMDELRIGWDILIDIDSPSLNISSVVAYYVLKVLIEGFRFREDSIITKFSGNKGWHIIIPWENLPKEFMGNKTSSLYPELAQAVSEYITRLIKPYVEEHLADLYGPATVASMAGLNPDELKDGIDMNKIAKIDSIALSKRHLFRAPFSLNEKSWLVSIPVPSKPEVVMEFSPEEARPNNIEVQFSLLEIRSKCESSAYLLLKRAYSWYIGRIINMIEEQKEAKSIPRVPGKIPPECFPPCIKNMLKGLEDGRKRALFILVNFLWRCGWSFEEIQKAIIEWNQRNAEPLRESYIRSQLRWHSKLKEPYMPPNCSHENYYKDMGVCTPDEFCRGIRNPLTYALKRYREWMKKRKRK